MRAKLISAVVCTAISGCSFLPVADYNREAVIKEAADKQTTNGKSGALTLEDARLLSIGWRDRLEAAALSKRNQALAAEEVLYYGTLLLTGAQAALAANGVGGMERDLRHVRNIAGGAALGSTLFSQHYKTAEQQPVFEKAAARMHCVTDLLADVQADVREQWPDEVFDTLTREDGVPLTKLYRDIPRQVVDFVERKSVPELRAALSSITVGTPTRAELIKTIEQYSTQHQEASEHAAAKTALAATTAYKNTMANRLMANGQTEDQAKSRAQALVNDPVETRANREAQTRFIIAVSAFESSLQACGVTYTQ